MASDYDRFGFSEKSLKGLFKDSSWIFRDGSYVPSRQEVASLPIDLLSRVVVAWMWESPSEIIPSNEQIEQVREILLSRDDAAQCDYLIDECNKYMGVDD